MAGWNLSITYLFHQSLSKYKPEIETMCTFGHFIVMEGKLNLLLFKPRCVDKQHNRKLGGKDHILSPSKSPWNKQLAIEKVIL